MKVTLAHKRLKARRRGERFKGEREWRRLEKMLEKAVGSMTERWL